MLLHAGPLTLRLVPIRALHMLIVLEDSAVLVQIAGKAAHQEERSTQAAHVLYYDAAPWRRASGRGPARLAVEEPGSRSIVEHLLHQAALLNLLKHLEGSKLLMAERRADAHPPRVVNRPQSVFPSVT